MEAQKRRFKNKYSPISVKNKNIESMITRFEPSEMPLAPDQTPYHIRIKPETLADKVILVGDPARVEMIAKRFDRITAKTSNRELVSCSGTYKGKPLTVLSTGMGVGCIDIVVNELDVCANINLQTRQPNPTFRSLELVRIGTCGSIQPDLEIGSAVASQFVVGTDGLAYYYQGTKEVNEDALTESFSRHCLWREEFPKPYAIGASNELMERVAYDMQKGITVTAGGFYAPQGRQIRLPLADRELNERLKTFSYQGLRVTNYEMETSALYMLGTMLGHKTLTLCSVIAGRSAGKFSKDYHTAMQELIDTVLERI